MTAPSGLWRSRTNHTMRWFAIIVAFAVMCLIGLVVIGLLVWFAGLIGLPAVPTWVLWLVLATLVLPFALRARSPALVDGEQGWTEFVIRAVIIGEQTARPLWWRVATIYAFGPGLAGYAIVYGVQALLGLV